MRSILLVAALVCTPAVAFAKGEFRTGYQTALRNQRLPRRLPPPRTFMQAVGQMKFRAGRLAGHLHRITEPHATTAIMITGAGLLASLVLGGHPGIFHLMREGYLTLGAIAGVGIAGPPLFDWATRGSREREGALGQRSTGQGR